MAVTEQLTVEGDQWLVGDLARNSLTKAKKDRREMAVSAVYTSTVYSLTVCVALSTSRNSQARLLRDSSRFSVCAAVSHHLCLL